MELPTVLALVVRAYLISQFLDIDQVGGSGWLGDDTGPPPCAQSSADTFAHGTGKAGQVGLPEVCAYQHLVGI